MKPDLESLYSQLDLPPNCSLEEFQRAYRRRIGELHPDRQQHAQPQSPESRAQLRHLIVLYATVNRFHRRYGRMPGGRSARLPGYGTRRMTAQLPRDNVPDDDDGDAHSGRRFALTIALLFAALLTLVAFWSWLTATSSQSAA